MTLPDHELRAAVRRLLSHVRWQSPGEVAEQLRRAGVETDADEVALALADCTGVSEAGGRWRRA